MTSADAMRASDNDREKVVQALQEQVGEGRLTLTEFEQRSTDAYATAKTVGDLRALTKDLPVDPLAPPKPALASWQQPWPFPVNTQSMNPQWMAPHRGAYPGNRAGGPPGRRVHPVRVVAAAILILWAVAAVTTVLFHVFPWPLLIVMFFFFAGGRRRRFR
jgi:hypothetical protein